MESAVRQDALAVTDAEEIAAGVAYRKAKRNLTKKERDGEKRGKSGKGRGGGETLNGVNP